MEPSFPPLPQCSIPHPFRLGAPSYVYPADILPNVEALAPYVDDIELVLFESRGTAGSQQTAEDQRQTPEGIVSNIPSPDTIARLVKLAQQNDLTYTVHFPIDRHLGSPVAAERQALQRQMLAIMESTRPLRPFAYILHLEGVTRDSDPSRIQTWANDIAGLLPALIECAGDPSLFCVENLNYPFAWCEGLLDKFGLGVCIDFGHLWIGGYDADAHLKRYLPRTRVIHLHGERDGRDHLALAALAPARLRQLLNSIDNFTGVLTLEIFNYEGVRDSVACLNQWISP
ncbi:MAG: cobamide remodeling phosphodiesterase CbiR [Kiritimatiellae bacterium]|nr:cobamide remodeling phosphodiesterase CbiR [Kiritimatiellia bacterium]